ncbi:glycosyltransferase family 2 protein [uncultured Mobiluncus sp.]|uniref:glycosyltransferase family 2 protein n=1 Tax=uncultured Mobiluncus sp. TaxID=293425 RepID=UPI002614918A|nr:glycosyltransferase family 2 protein [uncultured Mobiluncus sp.]
MAFAPALLNRRNVARLLVIIPAWNEEKALPLTLPGISRELPEADILVVNDGSSDNTTAAALNAGVECQVATLPVNLGVGGALRVGYEYAVKQGYDYACQIDADGQHDPKFVREMLEAAKSSAADVVIGARFAGIGDYQMHGPRKWASKMLAGLLSAVTRARLTDPTSGFKLTNARANCILANHMPVEYLGDTIEALVIMRKAGLKVTQVGVEMHERVAGLPSHSAWKSAQQLFRAMATVLVALTRRKIDPPNQGAE